MLTLAAGGLLALGGYIVAFVRSPRSSLAADRLTVAVLPVEDIGGDTAQLFVADGVTHQLITDLAQVATLDVVSSRTMLLYRDSAKPTREIARERRADAVVASTIQRLGDTVRMTAQLTLADQDGVLWAQSYEGTRGDLLRIQREVARAVANQLRRLLTPAQQAGLATARAMDPIALDLYIRGRYSWNKRGRAALLESIQLFNRALDVDPTFALAYSGMADAYVQLGYGSLLRPDDAFPKAREAARRALELDSTLAEPHATLGYVHMYYDWDWTAADRAFRRALVLNPGYATAHEWYGLFLAAMGRFDDAIAHERRAQELDPLSAPVTGTAAWVLGYSGHLEEAEREAAIALRMDPGFELGHFYLGRIQQAQGRLDSALAHYAATGRLRNWIPTIAADGYVYALQDRRREATAVLAQMDSIARGVRHGVCHGADPRRIGTGGQRVRVARPRRPGADALAGLATAGRPLGSSLGRPALRGPRPPTGPSSVSRAVHAADGRMSSLCQIGPHQRCRSLADERALERVRRGRVDLR